MPTISLPYEMIPRYSVSDELTQFYWLKEFHFQVIKYGKFCSFHFCPPNHFLFDQNLSNLLLDKCVEGIKLHPVTIYRKSTGQTWKNYNEVEIKNQLLKLRDININTDGLKIWHYKFKYLFVSPDLIKEIRKVEINDLVFSILFYVPNKCGFCDRA